MRKAVIILFLSLLAYAAPAQTFELDEDKTITRQLYAKLLTCGNTDVNPLYKNLFYDPDEETLDPDDPFFFLIIQNILTLDIPCTVSRMPEYGIYEFFNRFVSPPNVCIFLKSGNVCEILAMAPLMGLDVLEKQINSIYDYFYWNPDIDPSLELKYIKAACDVCFFNLTTLE